MSAAEAEWLSTKARHEVFSELTTGMDKLFACGEHLAKESKNDQLDGVRTCLRDAVASFSEADQEAKRFATHAQGLLENQVAERGKLEKQTEEVEASIEKCKRDIEARKQRRTDLAKEVDRHAREAKEAREHDRRAQDEVMRQVRKRINLQETRAAMTRYASPFFSAASTAVTTIVDDAERRVEQHARAAAQAYRNAADRAYSSMQEEKKQAELELLRLKEAQRSLQSLREDDDRIAASIVETKQSIATAQDCSSKLSGLWRITKEVFSSAKVARDMAEGPAFRLSLLQAPLEDIANSEGYGELKQHQLLRTDGAQSLLERLSERLAKDMQMTHQIAADLAHLL